MKRPLILLLLACLDILLTAAAASAAQKPNILVILADDMGYSDIGSYGGEIATPHLDRLSAGGVRFTQFYNNARCSPTRAALLTGLHPQQAGVGWLDADWNHRGYRGHIVDECVTLPTVLRDAGYHTFMTGKWHLGRAPQHGPLASGFDRFYGIRSGITHFFEPKDLVENGKSVSPLPEDFYLTHAIGDQTIRYLREHCEKSPKQPFFGYVAFTAPHWPLHAPAAAIERYRGKYFIGWDALREKRLARMKQLGIVPETTPLSPRSPAYPGHGQGTPPTEQPTPAWDSLTDEQKRDMDLRMAVYAAMVDTMDQNIGRIITAMEETGTLENTLILFLSDNGGCGEETIFGFDGGTHYMRAAKKKRGEPITKGTIGAPDSYSAYGMCWANVSNTPFRMYKHFTHEGGIATPLIAHWPAGIAARGAISGEPGHVIDIMATCLDVAGATSPKQRDGRAVLPIEGVSLAPAFAQQPLRRPTPLFWEHEGNRAVRDGQWKLVSRYGHPWELFDISSDRAELNDLASQHPERVREMAARYDAWAPRAHVVPWEQLLKEGR
jgi:arylsulfatase